ncbi:MAG: hypothetical protein U1E69_07050 [Tabrizicola sp.]|uniref:peptidoglycan-binding domain-containing protein n=1 Tax=Tabrizicola sp. TaxID=2005166 RepID=UPI002AB96DB4|nr:hypothetical protein [Tabrizicola sp.]MDZ4086546.1 hypothetical protein [Tabrizicola sp.]
MNRRSFLLSIPATMVAMTAAHAEGDALAVAFNNLSATEKVAAQEKLAAGGFYTGGLDGSFGPGTKSAAINAAAFIKDNSYGKIIFDLSSTSGAEKFLVSLTTGDLDKYLWGEGDESDGG